MRMELPSSVRGKVFGGEKREPRPVRGFCSHFVGLYADASILVVVFVGRQPERAFLDKNLACELIFHAQSIGAP